MPDLDPQEINITRELIKNPRVSDNAISRATGIPVMSVNRKRKILEEKGLISYYTSLNTFETGVGIFHARQLYTVQMRSGITREEYITYLKESKDVKETYSKYVAESYVGEQNGRLAIIMIIEAETEAELVEIFNGRIVKKLKEHFGQDAVTDILTARISMPVRLFHNYMPTMNMEKGKIKKDWPDDYIFVTDKKKENENQLKNKKVKRC